MSRPARIRIAAALVIALAALLLVRLHKADGALLASYSSTFS